MAAREFRDHDRPQCAQHCPCKICILCAGRGGIDQPTQVVHADSEMPFSRPSAAGIKAGFVIAFGLQHLGQVLRQCLLSGPIAEEIAADHCIEDAGVT